METQGNNKLMQFGMVAIGQIIVGTITVVVQRKVIHWLDAREIEKHNLKPIKGFQSSTLKS